MGQHQGSEGFPGLFHALDFNLCIIVINFNILAFIAKPSPGVQSPSAWVSERILKFKVFKLISSPLLWVALGEF